nr:ATP-binding protein [Desulfolithobacter dissulfuricans]
MPEIYTDRQKVLQILLNLANNAVKFTDKGEVRITCTIDDNTVKISVSDTGTGIKEENMVYLFEAFRQIDGTARRRYEGAGLGLHLCRKLVTLLGGEIWAQSEYGKGSIFTFTLPVRLQEGEPHEKKDLDRRG